MHKDLYKTERRTVSAKEPLLKKEIIHNEYKRPVIQSSKSWIEEKNCLCPKPPKRPASNIFQRKLKNKALQENEKCIDDSPNKQPSEHDSLFSDETSSLDSLNDSDCKKLYTFSSRPRPTSKAILNYSIIATFRENFNSSTVDLNKDIIISPRVKHLEVKDMKMGLSPRVFFKNVTKNSVKEVIIENLELKDLNSNKDAMESFEQRMLLSIQRKSNDDADNDDDQNCDVIIDEETFSDYSDDESTSRSINCQRKPSLYDYSDEIEMLGRGYLGQPTLTPRDAEQIVQMNLEAQGSVKDTDEKLELVYDYQLHLFFDPRTHKYYQLNTT